MYRCCILSASCGREPGRPTPNSGSPAETPLVLTGCQGNRRVVIAGDVTARAMGVRIGMPATKGQALVQSLLVPDADARSEAEASKKIGGLDGAPFADCHDRRAG